MSTLESLEESPEAVLVKPKWKRAQKDQKMGTR